MSTTIYTSGGKVIAREGNSTWPANTILFSQDHVHSPRGMDSPANPYDAWRRSLKPLPVKFTTGQYQVPAMLADGSWELCSYPDTIETTSKGPRCWKPKGLTAAEQAALQKEKAANEAAISSSISEQIQYREGTPKWECSQPWQSGWSTSSAKPTHYPPDAKQVTSVASGRTMYAWRYEGLRNKDDKTKRVYTKPASGGGKDYYDCATDKKLYSEGPVVVRGIDGLGSSEATMDDATVAAKSEYRKTEILLVLAIAAAALVVVR